jgi:hypothetical protein
VSNEWVDAASISGRPDGIAMSTNTVAVPSRCADAQVIDRDGRCAATSRDENLATYPMSVRYVCLPVMVHQRTRAAMVSDYGRSWLLLPVVHVWVARTDRAQFLPLNKQNKGKPRLSTWQITAGLGTALGLFGDHSWLPFFGGRVVEYPVCTTLWSTDVLQDFCVASFERTRKQIYTLGKRDTCNHGIRYPRPPALTPCECKNQR